MKPADMSKRLGIASATVRAWSNQYARFFSPTGAGSSTGRHRAFNEHDAAILWHIKTLKSNGMSSDEIAAALESLQAADFADLPGAPETINLANVAMVPAAAANAQLTSETRALLRRIADLQHDLDQLKEDARADRQLIIDLSAKLASAQTELEFWRSGRLGAEQIEKRD